MLEIGALLFGTAFFGSNVAGTVAGGILGNLAHEQVCKIFGSLRDRLHHPTPENHDLQVALLAALRDGIETTAQKYLKTLPKPEQQQVKTWLQQEVSNLNQLIKEVKAGRWPWASVSDWVVLLKATPSELANMQRRQVNSQLRQLKENLEQSLHLDALPPDFRENFVVEWLPWVNLYLAEAIKTNPRVSQILQVELLLDVQDSVNQLTELFNHPDQFLGAVQHIDFNVAELRSQFQDWAQQLSGRLDVLETNIIQHVDSRVEELIAVIERMNASQPQAVSANVINIAPNLENWCGRAAEINQLGQWLSNPQVDTIGIQGLGGAGKSSLAAYIYRTAQGFAAKFWADVSQQPYFTAFAEQAIMALGNFSRADIAQLNPTQLSNKLLSCLNQQRCLLVIDNLETLLDEKRDYRNPSYGQFFGRWVKQGYTSVLLVTTQEKPYLLQAEPCWLPLSGLEVTDGVQLLLDLGIQGELEQLTAFVQAADGHPLTLWLAAGFLRQYCQSQLSRAGELGLREFNQLADAATGSHRQQREICRAWILQQHFQRLTPELRQFLLNLTVYRQAFNREAAAFMLVEGMVAASPLVTQKTLQELINRSLLLAVANGCYQFQPFVLAYTQQQATDFNLAHSQAVHYWRSIFTSEDSWQTLADLKPYLETFHHYCEQGQYERAYATLDICYKFLDVGGYYAIIVKLYEQLVEAWQVYVEAEAKSNLGMCLTYLGLAYESLCEYKKAISSIENHLLISHEIGNQAVEGNAMRVLGRCYYSLGQYQKAIDYHQKHLAISRELSDRLGESRALGNLGLCYKSLGQYQQALDHQQQCLEISREIKNPALESAALVGLGYYYESIGQYQQAINYSQQSLEISCQIGNRAWEGRALGNMGSCYNSLEQYQQAMDYSQQSLMIARETGNRGEEGRALYNIGLCCESLGQRQEAIAFLYQAYQIFQSIGTEHHAAQARSDLIRLGESL